MLSWKAIVITLVLSLTGALIVQYWSDGPAEHTPPGAEPNRAAGPSGGGASTIAAADTWQPDAQSSARQSSSAMNAAPIMRSAPSGGEDPPPDRVAVAASTGTPLTWPYLEDDRDLAQEIAAAGKLPEPTPMTAADRALLEELGVDLDQAGLADESTDFVGWFPGRAERMFGADGRPLPRARESLPDDDRD